ncbi:AIPR family protein [Streptomyces sp. NPDC059402]|uniref:AIPR family protein n=1 Tax=Streptomyces sp. NPDC059402 TaxID=3346822 RepID=UPI0036952CFC
MSVVHVRYVQRALEQRFTGLISTDDLPRQLDADKRHDAFLSRGLAALAVQVEHKRENAEAALAVFDGQDDRGLDAIAVEPRSEHARITLVQAKWNHRGKAKFDESDAHKLLYGLQLIIDQSYTSFNQRFQPHVPLIEKVFDSPSPRINLVLALLRTEPINRDVRKILDDGIKIYNDVDPNMVDIKVLDLRDFHREILGDAAAPKINTRVRLEGFGMEDMPYKAMHGTMTAPDVATLYGENRRSLFARNIRDALDLSDVNQKIRNTLLERPQDFWYFSNGITMLCDTVKPVGVPVKGGVGEFEVAGLSVVNGAQTVSAMHTAFELDPEKTAPGRVLVRLISLENCPPGFGEEVTTTTNTQNPIKDRDFKALDPTQAKLRDEFTLALR